MQCALCNRPLLAAAVFIGAMPIGPVCGKRAGLIEKARKNHGALRLADSSLPRLHRQKREDRETIDMFEGLQDAA